MSTVHAILDHPAVLQWGWVLAHFLWQGAILGLFAWLLAACTSRSAARVRYILLTVCLFIAAILPVVTWFSVDVPAPAGESVSESPAAGTTETTAHATEISRPHVSESLVVEAHTDQPVKYDTPASSPVPTATFDLKSRLEACLPWFVVIWFLGVFVLSLRMAGGWYVTKRLVADGTPLREDWVHRIESFFPQLNFFRSVRWIESSRVRVPQVIGWLRPVVLAPSSLFTALTPTEIESLLLHELVHIRRHDYLVNLVQCVIETVFFFHPAVRWLSHRIRLERELACDEMVVNVTGDKVTFSRALLSIADQSRLPRPALAASDGDLTTRVHAVLGMKRQGSSQGLAVVLCLAACLITFGMLTSYANEQGDTPNVSEEAESDAPPVERFLEEGLPVPDLSGKIVDSSGTPVAEAVVFLRQAARSSDENGPVEWKDLARTISDENGSFGFSEVLDQKSGRVNPAYDIVAFKPGGAYVAKQVWPTKKGERPNPEYDTIGYKQGYALGWKRVRPKESVTDIRVALNPPVSLKGTIVDPSGKPIGEAKVTLKHLMSIRHITQADLEQGRWPSWGDPDFLSLYGCREAPETKTDANGQFELKGLPTNSGAILEVAQPEYLIKRVYAATVAKLDPEVAAKAKRDVQAGEMSLSLEPGYRIRIKVVDAETEKPIRNVRYNLIHQGYSFPPRRHSENGVIEVNHIAWSDYTDSPECQITVFPPEGTAYLACHPRPEWQKADRLKELEIKLRKGIRVRGRVISKESGSGVANVNVVATGPPIQFTANKLPHQYAASPVPTDAEGYFEVYCPPGDHTFRPDGRIRGFMNPRESGASSGVVKVTEQGPDHTPEIALVSAPRFRMIVTTPEGRPVKGASVRARAHTAVDSYFPIEGITDEKGEYLLDELFMSGSAVQKILAEEVVIRDSDNSHGARLLLKRPVGAVEQRIEVKLQPLGTVIGRTVDEQTGKPVAGTSIYLYKQDHETNSYSAIGESTTTGPDGSFQLKGVLPGVEHFLSMSHKKFKVPNGIHLQFQVKDDKPFDFGDIKLGSLTPPDVPELAPITAPDVSGLAPETAFEKLESSYKDDFARYRKEFDELGKKYSAEDVVARREPTPAYCEAFLKLAQVDPESEIGLKSCLWIVNARRIAGSEKQSLAARSQAEKQIQEHFLDRAEMAECISVAIDAFVKPENRRRDIVWPEQLAQAADALMEANPHRDVHAKASFYMAEHLMRQLMGRGYPTTAPTADRVELCRKYLTRVRDDYPEYEHFIYGTYGKAAERLLYDLDHMLLGKTPPDFTATDVNGKEVKLSDYRGKLVIVDFWQSDPATGDHHGLKRILDQAGDKVAVLGVVSEPKEKVLEDVKKHQIAYPVFADGDKGPLFTLWNVHTWPTTFLLDENGVILYRGGRGTALENTLLEKLAENDE